MGWIEVPFLHATFYTAPNIPVFTNKFHSVWSGYTSCSRPENVNTLQANHMNIQQDCHTE